MRLPHTLQVLAMTTGGKARNYKRKWSRTVEKSRKTGKNLDKVGKRDI
jgi:hypothetical protein